MQQVCPGWSARAEAAPQAIEWWKDEIADLPDWHAAAADLPAPKRVTHAASERCLASPALIRECERVRAEAQKAGRRFKPIDSPN